MVNIKIDKFVLNFVNANSMHFFIFPRFIVYRYRKYKLISFVKQEAIISFRLFNMLTFNQRFLKTSFIFW